MRTSSRIKLGAAVVCLALAWVAPSSQAKSRNTQPLLDSSTGGLLDGSLLDTHSPLGNGYGPHHGHRTPPVGGGSGGSTDTPPPVTCNNGSVTTNTVVPDPVTTPPVGKQRRFHNSLAGSSVVTDSFVTSQPSLSRKSLVTDSLVTSGLQRFHHKKNKGGGSSGGSSPPPPTSSGPPCAPDPCVTDPLSCNTASNDPPPRGLPEPGTLALVGLSLGAAAIVRRRTKSASK